MEGGGGGAIKNIVATGVNKRREWTGRPALDILIRLCDNIGGGLLIRWDGTKGGGGGRQTNHGLRLMDHMRLRCWEVGGLVVPH